MAKKHEKQGAGKKPGHNGKRVRLLRRLEKKHHRHRVAVRDDGVITVEKHKGTLTRRAILHMNAHELRELVAEMAERMGMLEGNK